MRDNVNLDSRCASVSLEYNVYRMTTSSTRSNAEKTSDEILFRQLDRLIFKGKSKLISVHQIIGFRHEIPKEVCACVELYEQAI